MPPPYAAAVIALKPGEYTRKPVQTQFGWHVIQLIETRDLTPPAYEQVKGRLEQVVQQKKFRKYMDELMATAKVEKLDQAATAPAAGAPAAPGAAPAAPAAPVPAPAAAPTPAPTPEPAPNK
jgi:peptidyl-prolyl cis-trans isomerase C